MKITNETIQLLKNYATINSNILIREGSTLSTISSGGNIFATAKISEVFPKEVAIYDLNSLLALLTLTDDQEVDFGDKSLTITKDGGEFEYYYSEPNILLPKPEKCLRRHQIQKTSLSLNYLHKKFRRFRRHVVLLVHQLYR